MTKNKQKPKHQSEKYRQQRVEKEPHKTWIGLFLRTSGKSGLIVCCKRKQTFPDIKVTKDVAKGLQEGDLIIFSQQPGGKIEILNLFGNLQNPKSISLLAAFHAGVQRSFTDEIYEELESLSNYATHKREDLRHVPFVTIDGADARDFDDAVWAMPDHNPQNQHGWRAMVAIADVSHYVRPKSALDKEAYERGNSVYFPDRVIPMLPEKLSNDLCSLRPHEDRPVLVVDLIIGHHGKIKSHRFKRALIRSHARLTYDQVQDALDGKPDELVAPLMESVIKPLFGVYQSLLKARQVRHTLNINSDEKKIMLNEAGEVYDVIPRIQKQAHQIIEELMIAANIAAAKTLKAKKWPCLHRIHEEPDALKIENLKAVLKTLGLPVPQKDTLTPKHFNDILAKVKDTSFAMMVNTLVLRSQMQAKYSPHELKHYGLQLDAYAHFTSPIRRYADLIVHRCLISALSLGDGGIETPPTIKALETIGEHLSSCERQAALAERESVDRYLVHYLANQVGNIFESIIVSVTEFGVFVSLFPTGAQGFVPIHRLPKTGRLYFDPQKQALVVGAEKKTVKKSSSSAKNSKSSYSIGDKLTVLLTQVDEITGSLSLESTQFLDKEGLKKEAKKKNQDNK